jgi:membrane-associated protease RseP (regulator of RpoE activity)
MAIVAVVVLLFSCVAGALAGGFAGFLVGRHQGRLAVERALAGSEGFWPHFPEMPMPMPEPWREVPPGDDLQPRGVTGAVVVEVIPGMPAEQAGLRVGDVIVAIDRTPIDRMHPLDQVIAQYEPGDRITLRFQRRGEEQSVRVILGEYPDRPGWPYLGVRFEMMTPPQFELPGG